MGASVLPDFLDRLKAERDRLANMPITELFEREPNRFDRFSVETDGLLFDYSKNRVDEQALRLLIEMAEAAELPAKRDAMFSGAKINTTEDRAVLHTALRRSLADQVMLDGSDVMQEIAHVLHNMERFAEAVRNGTYAVSGGKVRDVVNIGIGGSDLGPRMVTQALSAFCNGPNIHYVANVDGADLSDTLARLNPQTTLFIIASKTFTTQETMTNAHSAMHWMKEGVGAENAGIHFCALSTNLEATRNFGIADDRIFGFWDWVGGRYSIWSAIGLSVIMAVGPKRFRELLEGGRAADAHFQTAPLAENIPVLMGLLGIWYRNFWDMPAHAVLPYDERLARFTAWLQQLDMESNGKSVALDGEPVTYQTGPIIFGEPGTNGQHAFYQLIHQGTTVIPCDFLVAVKPTGTSVGEDHHRLLLANCLAQSEALMVGRSLEETGGNHHKLFSGNRPSNTFVYKQLDPHTLGMLMAFYEHKVFVQGVLWGINSFDQWGVELGKQLAKQIDPMLASGDASGATNSSTKGLLETVSRFSNDTV